jgi:Ser/Thr protein kinase RdoA (MazF antagonist)
MNEIIKQALNQFGINGESVRKINKNNSWEVDGRFILKFFSTDKENAERVARLNALLYQENAPVAKPHLARTDSFCASVEGNYYTLSDKLPGTSEYRIYEGDSKKRVYSMGCNLAKLHVALKKMDGKMKVWDNDIMDELHGWILKEIREKQIPVKREVIQYCADFAGLYHRLPRQIIHRDPHSGNMCMENDEITGIYDLDLFQINSRVFDMCYAFFPYKHEFELWQAHCPYFFSGYQSVSAVSKDEMVGYACMAVLIELLFTAHDSIRSCEDTAKKTLELLHWVYDNRNEIEKCATGALTE